MKLVQNLPCKLPKTDSYIALWLLILASYEVHLTDKDLFPLCFYYPDFDIQTWHAGRYSFLYGTLLFWILPQFYKNSMQFLSYCINNIVCFTKTYNLDIVSNIVSWQQPFRNCPKNNLDSNGLFCHILTISVKTVSLHE